MARFALTLYNVAWALALPWVKYRLRRRADNDPAYAANAEERFAKKIPPGPFDVWIHAVSVGETRAAEPIIRQWLRDTPDARVLLTHMTPTGRSTGEALFASQVTQCYLPYDTAAFARTFLKITQPRMGLIMETELWPNLISQAARRSIKLWLVNARLSQKSALRYAWWLSLTRHTLRQLTGVLAQADADAQRFVVLGAQNVVVTGNVKFDCTVPTNLAEQCTKLRTPLGDRRFWVAGSTREGEEAQLLQALVTHPLRKSMTVLIVPRHPQRFDEVVTIARSLGYTVARRSTMRAEDHAEVVVGDTMGEMFAYYAIAEAAFMGGSLATGSQNLIEPCAVGTPVVLGPSIFNFAAAAQAAIAIGAAVQVETPQAALDQIKSLCDNSLMRDDRARAARAFFEKNQGATTKTLTHIRI